jgi:hypothetical protein
MAIARRIKLTQITLITPLNNKTPDQQRLGVFDFQDLSPC